MPHSLSYGLLAFLFFFLGGPQESVARDARKAADKPSTWSQAIQAAVSQGPDPLIPKAVTQLIHKTQALFRSETILACDQDWVASSDPWLADGVYLTKLDDFKADTCLSTHELKEYSCKSGVLAATLLDCSQLVADATCLDGACVLPPDQDADGVPDGQDNCPWKANPDQADVAGVIGVADACECVPDVTGSLNAQFEDSQFLQIIRQAVAQALGLPQMPVILTSQMISAVKTLQFPLGQPVSSMVGMHCLSKIEALMIDDLWLPEGVYRGLAGLDVSHLSQLSLRQAALTTLPWSLNSQKLTWLDLAYSDVVVPANLKDFKQLVHLDLSGKFLWDAGEFQHLPKLAWLGLRDNYFVNLPSFSKLTNLVYLDLAENSSLQDVSSLLGNPGLGVGDQVDLSLCPAVPPQYVKALRAKGVSVCFEEPGCF